MNRCNSKPRDVINVGLHIFVRFCVTKPATLKSHNKNLQTANFWQRIFNGKFVALLQRNVRQFRNAFSTQKFSRAKKKVSVIETLTSVCEGTGQAGRSHFIDGGRVFV